MAAGGTDDWILEEAQALYEKILQTANYFLRNAKYFEINILQDHNPSYEELARIMERLGVLIYETVNDKDPLLAQKATDYACYMKNMGIAIAQNDREGLDHWITELDKMSFL